jgi:hypothetical protein
MSENVKLTQLKIYQGKVNFQYTAEALECDNRYWYRVDNIQIEISQLEYNHVIINPNLYYFSTALKLHYLIHNEKKKNLNSLSIEINYKDYRTVDVWVEDVKKKNYSIPLQARWALSLEMEIYGVSFPEAYEKFIKDNWLMLFNKNYIFNESYLSKLLEIKRKNGRWWQKVRGWMLS